MKVRLTGRVVLDCDEEGNIKKAQLLVDPAWLKDALAHFDSDEEVVIRIYSKHTPEKDDKEE